MIDTTDFFAADESSVEDELRALGSVDLIVGIPSYEEADSIAHVVRQADAGLREYFSELDAVIINADNDSPDGTDQAFLAAGSRTPLVYVSTPEGARGKGNNFWNLFQAARGLDAEAIVAVDADLVSITPQWIRNLGGPILDGQCDYVTPVYARNEYDGTITNNICYPLIYGLLGQDLRQPIGGDFGLSTALSNAVLETEWEETTRDYGIDIFLTVTALLQGFDVGQTNLGAKVHKPSAPKLGPMFTQVVNTLFDALVRSRDTWLESEEVTTVPTFDGIELGEPQGLAVDYKSIVRTTLSQYASCGPTLRTILGAEDFATVEEMMESGKMRMDAELWCRCVYDLFEAYRTSEKTARPPIVEALKPLFFARVATFYRDTLELGSLASEAEIAEQARLFRRMRGRITED